MQRQHFPSLFIITRFGLCVSSIATQSNFSPGRSVLGSRGRAAVAVLGFGAWWAWFPPPSLLLLLLPQNLPSCLPTGTIGCCRCFPPDGNLVNVKSSWLYFKWDWKWSQQGCILPPWLVLSGRKTCQGQVWLLDGTMPTLALKNLEEFLCKPICDLLWVILGVIVVWWCHRMFKAIFFLKLSSQCAVVCWFGDCLGSFWKLGQIVKPT